uniref:PH domain-containing protein n=1 Tax=Macrostomum lignano TaxID=282301 RepID=A0A1I8F6T7_9PLAT
RRRASHHLALNLEGYLFRKAQHKKFKPWVRRWFFIKDNRLYYCKKRRRLRCHLSARTICESVPAKSRPQATDRRYVLELIAPSRTHLLRDPADLPAVLCTALQSGWQHHRSPTRSPSPSTPGSASEGLQSLSESGNALGGVGKFSSSTAIFQSAPLIKPPPFDAVRSGALNEPVSWRRSTSGLPVRLIQSAARQFRFCCECGADKPRWSCQVASHAADTWEPFHAEAHASAGQCQGVNAIKSTAGQTASRVWGPTADPARRKEFITDKWPAPPLSSPAARRSGEPDAALRLGRGRRRRPDECLAACWRARPASVKPAGLGNRTPLIACARAGQRGRLRAALLSERARVDLARRRRCVFHLLRRRASQTAAPTRLATPHSTLGHAIPLNADSVTLLRLAPAPTNLARGGLQRPPLAAAVAAGGGEDLQMCHEVFHDFFQLELLMAFSKTPAALTATTANSRC